MSRSKKPSSALAFRILDNLIVMWSPSPGKSLFCGDITREEKIDWLSGTREAPYLPPLLAIDTSRMEARLLEQMGMIKGPTLFPAVATVNDKGMRIMSYPAYRLTEMGRQWCLLALEANDGDEINERLQSIVERGLQAPDADYANEVMGIFYKD